MRISNLGNKLTNVLEAYFWYANAFFSTILMYLITKIKNITIGNKCRFYGKMTFKRGSKNIIIIGNKCTFRSSHTSNLIGINRPCIFSSIGENGSILKIGNDCGFSGTVIGCFSNIILGNNVRCGANTLITDSDWHLDDYRSGQPKPIHIHDNVWLGVNVIVMKGVTIGENSVIGAGSIVTKDIPSNVIAAGNPCKVIKSLN